MKRVLGVLLLMAIPSLLFAKGNTSRITIQGSNLKAPIEITDAEILKKIFVWGGPPKWLIVDGAQLRLEHRPQGLPRYEVSFYAKLPREERERLVYVVFYEYDPATGQGYVYVPGKGEKGYTLDVSTILNGANGKWFHSWSAWDDVACPLLAKGK
jgi:hypothetical protein